MPVVTVGKSLREKLGDEAVDSLIDLIKQSQADQQNNILQFVEEKFERRLTEEISKTRVELISLISETKSELISLISEIKSEMATTKSDLIKWMFIFWVGQFGMILGVLFAFFK
ncbi:MAG: LA_3696 family protein [bacterium]